MSGDITETAIIELLQAAVSCAEQEGGRGGGNFTERAAASTTVVANISAREMRVMLQASDALSCESPNCFLTWVVMNFSCTAAVCIARLCLSANIRAHSCAAVNIAS